MITVQDYCLKIIILDKKKWVTFVQKVIRQKLESMTVHHMVMILII